MGEQTKSKYDPFSPALQDDASPYEITRLSAFGETKTLSEWVADPRCQVPWGTLYVRLHRQKMSPEDAISTPLPPKVLYEAFGECKSVKAWSRDPRCVVNLTTLHNRIKDGVPFEIALTEQGWLVRNHRASKKYSLNGEWKTVHDWAEDERCHVTEAQLRNRVYSGVPLDIALTGTVPLAQKRKEYEAFGARKTLIRWVKDPRCKCSYHTLVTRLKDGIPFAEALVSTQPTPKTARSVMLEAFGESKSAGDWARDSRCVVSLLALRDRIWKGFPAEKAITTVPRLRYFTGFGERKKLSEWLKDPRATVTGEALLRRMRKGEPFEEALTRPRTDSYVAKDSILVTIFGETKSTWQWAKDPRCGVSAKNLWRRIQAGTPPEIALKDGRQYERHARYTAFGETKLLADWVRDPRCMVGRTTLRSRVLIDGEPCEQAMSRPAKCALPLIWDLEKFPGGSYEALEVDAARFRVDQEEVRVEKTRVPRKNRGQDSS